MDVVRLDIATPVNALRQLTESGWSSERRWPLHLLLAGWDVHETAAWTGRSPEALRADWRHFFELAESSPPEPVQLIDIMVACSGRKCRRDCR